jgi:chromosome segregation ATPase
VDIVENIKKQFEGEIKRVEKEQREARENMVDNNEVLKKDDMIKKLNKKVEEMKVLLADERELQNEHILRIKILEETLKKLDKEYENVVNKFTEMQKENDSLHKSLSEVKRNNGDNRHKFEDLIGINNELKEKIIQHENSIKTHLDDIKNLLKRNTMLQKHTEVVDYLPIGLGKIELKDKPRLDHKGRKTQGHQTYEWQVGTEIPTDFEKMGYF